MRDRYDTKQSDKPFLFQESDLEICRFFSPSRFSRAPWSYQYATAHYAAALLGRSEGNLSDRLQDGKNEPHSFFALADQPRHRARPLIYTIGSGGIEKLREDGLTLKSYRLRRLEHEFFAGLIASSFEYAANTIPGVKVQVAAEQPGAEPFPDWPLFWLTTPKCRMRIAFEADTGSQDYGVIEEKVGAYLQNVAADTIVIFFTAKFSRVDGITDCVKRVITASGKPKSLARHFAVKHVAFDRFLYQIPPLTAWAVTGTYTQAGGDFSFMGEILGHRQAERPHSEARGH